MPPSKFEANPTLRLQVKHASVSLFPLVSSCSNDYFRAYMIIDFLANRLVFPNTVTNMLYGRSMKRCMSQIFISHYETPLIKKANNT